MTQDERQTIREALVFGKELSELFENAIGMVDAEKDNMSVQSACNVGAIRDALKNLEYQISTDGGDEAIEGAMKQAQEALAILDAESAPPEQGEGPLEAIYYARHVLRDMREPYNSMGQSFDAEIDEALAQIKKALPALRALLASRPQPEAKVVPMAMLREYHADGNCCEPFDIGIAARYGYMVKE
jgi:hypothetical protein